MLRDSTSRTFEFHKRRQLFIRTHNETLSAAAQDFEMPLLVRFYWFY